MVCAGSLSAQTFTITDSMQWKAYDDFNTALLDKTASRYIYKADTQQPKADHRGNTVEAAPYSFSKEYKAAPQKGKKKSKK